MYAYIDTTFDFDTMQDERCCGAWYIQCLIVYLIGATLGYGRGHVC